MHRPSSSCSRHKRTLTTSLAISLLAAAALHAQSSPTAQDHPQLPAFEVATIKPAVHDHPGAVGFLGRPGGRVYVGFTTIEGLIYWAFDLPPERITGIPPSLAKSEYEVNAVPPADSKSRAEMGPSFKATPNQEQREMLQSLLADRFGFKYHYETKEGSVYILQKGSGALKLTDAKDKTLDARGAVVMKQGGIVDGEAFGTNLSMDDLARFLTWNMKRPVLNRTGLNGAYDFHLDPDDPGNTDMITGCISAMRRLGLQLKSGKGPVEIMVVDSVSAPSEN
jgi:uncharacterized protein (TIGR03435 family)